MNFTDAFVFNFWSIHLTVVGCAAFFMGVVICVGIYICFHNWKSIRSYDLQRPANENVYDKPRFGSIIIFRFLMQTWTLELSNISFGNKVETWLYITDYSTGDCISVIGYGPTSFTNTTSGDTVPRFCTRSWPPCQGSRDHIWRCANLKKNF